MRHWKIIGAIIALLAEVVLQLSGYQNPSLAIALLLVMAGLLLWSAWPTISRIRVQKPIRFASGKGQANVSPATDCAQTDDKLTLVAKAVMEAKQITPTGKDIPVYITDSNRLTRLYAQELKDILVKLQDDQRVITIKSFPEWLLPYEHLTKDIFDRQIEATLDPSKKHFVVDALDTFDKWYKKICRK